MKPITTKRQFVALWNQGAFGNKLQTWTNWREIPRGFPLPVMCRPLLPGRIIREATVAQIHQTPFLQTGWHYNECAPDVRNTLQGELTWKQYGAADAGLVFWGAVRSGARMREMLASKAGFTFGYAVQQMLRKYCTPASYEDVMELVELYPDHIIELTAYEMELGWARGRNTIIWEVRQY